MHDKDGEVLFMSDIISGHLFSLIGNKGIYLLLLPCDCTVNYIKDTCSAKYIFCILRYYLKLNMNLNE